MIKLCVFDFDNTLMDGETIEFLGKAMNKNAQIAEITKRAMAGELDFFQSLKQRVSLLNGLSLQKAEQISKELPFIDGAKHLIKYLKTKGILVVVFSGGFHIATDYAQEILGFDVNFANELYSSNGILNGEVGGEMMFAHSKGIMLSRLKNLLKLQEDEVAAVGDGANDVSMFKEAGTCIAFCAKEILKSYATFVVDKKDLRELEAIL